MKPGALLAVLAIVATLLIGCSSNKQSDSNQSSDRESTTTSRAPDPQQLVPAPAELSAQCAAAADLLQFAVPCPGQVPEVRGRPATCPVNRGGSFGLPPCTGFAGLPVYLIFGLDVAGFDPSQAADSESPPGHLIVDAARHSDAPPQPCIGEPPIGSVTVSRWTTTEYRCSADANRVQREARHGEGAHLGHTLLAWSEAGVNYTASIHGHTATDLALLEQLVASITLVDAA